MAESESYWGEKHRPYVPIGIDPTELADLADAIIRGASIAHAEIADLRKLIEAIQSHKGARLCKIGADGKPMLDDPTILILRGGVIKSCICSGLDIGVALYVITNFVNYAGFWNAKFTADANFGSARFATRAHFQKASFAACASFNNASFAADADFRGTTFATDALFKNAGFAADADFDDASFAAHANFASSRIEGTLDLRGSIFAEHSRVFLRDAAVLPGGGVLLGESCFNRRTIQVPDRFTRWISSQDKDSWRTWFLEYIDAVAGLREVVYPWLGLGPRGAFILGEDSDERADLDSAAAQYNTLRGNFKQQPSTDHLEDLCHFRYMDLSRRAADPARKWHRVYTAWDWLIMRNCLGYLIQTHRILVSGLVVMVLFAAIYWTAYAISPVDAKPIDYVGPIELSQKNGWEADLLNPFYFSMMSFVTLGYGDFAPHGLLKFATAIEALLGVTLIALFTVSWGRKMIR